MVDVDNIEIGKAAMESGGSYPITKCQICHSEQLETILFLGFLPPVNKMQVVGQTPLEQPSYPASVLMCQKCSLVQLGLVVDPRILFPPEYPYTSSTTKILRENFAELYRECSSFIDLTKQDLVVDIGSNDGNLLSNFKDSHRVLGVTPENIGKIAVERGIPTLITFFNEKAADQILNQHGQARIVTATNVFAHMDDIHGVLREIKRILKPGGVFISESHYLMPLVETLQYDTVYHEHLRYYSLHSLKYLLNMHDLEVFHAKQIPTHGGSIRVYAGEKGKHKVQASVQEILEKEEATIRPELLRKFKDDVVTSKLKLMALLKDIKSKGERVSGISAPSRASTLVNYVGLDDGILDYVYEIQGSHKIGKYMPGTLIEVRDEAHLYEAQPEYALMLSWHIADELAPKIRERGYKGQFIVPLPEPRII